MRTAAANAERTPAALEQRLSKPIDREVLQILLAKLEDKAVLQRVAESAKDQAMRLASEQKAGAKSWETIFHEATAGGASIQMLGDALAAVSLFPQVQSDAKNGVQEASLNLIRRGDEYRIPEMVECTSDSRPSWSGWRLYTKTGVGARRNGSS